MKITLKYIACTAVTFFILNLLAIDLPASPMSPASSAQQVDLVKLKKKEEERKKKTKKSKYVVTNDNLDKIDTPKKPYSVVKVGEKGSKDAKGAADGVKTTAEARPGGETATDSMSNRNSKEYWQGKKRTLLSQIKQVKEDIASAEAEQKKLMLTYSAHDILAERTRMKNRVTELLKLIPQLKQQLVKLDTELEELEDQARKAGVPRGWLRDVDSEAPSKSDKNKAGARDK